MGTGRVYREMNAVLGLSSKGPIAGGLFAAAQSAAMIGSAAPAAGVVTAVVATAIAVVAPFIAAACVAAEYADSQRHGMGEPTTSELKQDSPFVLVVHNWGKVEMREFHTYEEARKAFETGRKLRRFLARMHKEGEAERDNGHGWKLPWEELSHAGSMACLDNGMRTELLKRRDKASSGQR